MYRSHTLLRRLGVTDPECPTGAQLAIPLIPAEREQALEQTPEESLSRGRVGGNFEYERGAQVFKKRV